MPCSFITQATEFSFSAGP
uniref:Uncharacterized protein n=1 Tax=Anguilla anguilla TaxID=7936 RepID=A0A0E9V6C8_ANGAN